MYYTTSSWRSGFKAVFQKLPEPPLTAFFIRAVSETKTQHISILHVCIYSICTDPLIRLHIQPHKSIFTPGSLIFGSHLTNEGLGLEKIWSGELKSQKIWAGTAVNMRAVIARPGQGTGSLNYLKTKCYFLWADVEVVSVSFCFVHTYISL